MAIKICIECGCLFNPAVRQKRICSRECLSIRERRQKNEAAVRYYYAHPEKQNKVRYPDKNANARAIQWALDNPKRANANKASAKKRVKRATPPWSNMSIIRKIYQECPDGYEVDHWVPLKGKSVSGLHVHWNLQYLTAEENRVKSNKWS